LYVGNASNVPIKFMVSTLRLPDPPSWLTFLQRDDLQDGFLYGTPPEGAQTVHMQVGILGTMRTSWLSLFIRNKSFCSSEIV